MGMINQPLSIGDDYSQEIITSARAISYRVDDFLTRQLWLEEVEAQEEVTPIWLRHRVLRLLLNDLEELGIFFNLDINEVLSSIVHHKLILTLRKVIDGEQLFNLLHGMDSSTYDEFCSYVDNCRVEYLEDGIIDIIERLSVLYPLNDNWGFLNENSSSLGCDEEFYDHIGAVIERCSEYGEPAYGGIPEVKSLAIIEKMNKQIAMINQIALSACTNVQQSAIINRYMGSYEVALTRPIHSDAIIHAYSLEEGERIAELEKLKLLYAPRWKHRIEYHESATTIGTLDSILVAASYYQENDTIATMKSKCMEALALSSCSDKIKASILEQYARLAMPDLTGDTNTYVPS